MDIEIYLKAFGLGFAIWLALALPMVVATIVALLPGEVVAKKILFVLFSSMMSYGTGVVVFVLLFPFHLLSVYFSPQWEAQGYNILASSVDMMADVGHIAPLIVVVICSIAIPVLGRKKYWRKYAN